MKDFVADGCAGLNQAHVYSADGVIKMERQISGILGEIRQIEDV